MAANTSCLSLADFGATVELWVKNVVDYSSQYNATSYAAANIIGEPRVFPGYGGINGAWAQGNITSNEFVVVEFAEKLFLTGIEIYETFNAGAVIRISARDSPTRAWTTLWQRYRPKFLQYSRCFTPSIKELSFSVNQLKLELDCTASQSWCEIDSVKIKGKRLPHPKPPSFVELSENLRELVNSSLFSDVKFLVEGHEVFAHRAILAVRSTYFRALLCNGMMESRRHASNEGIKVDDISHSGFLAMMHYIYTNDFDSITSPFHLTELIRIGDKFSLDGMKILSFHHLCRNIMLDNVIDVYRDAVENLPHLEDVGNVCLNFISKNFSKVTELPSFCALPQDVMLLILREAISIMLEESRHLIENVIM